MYKETALIAAAKCREDIDRIEAKIREETSTTPGSSGRDEMLSVFLFPFLVVTSCSSKRVHSPTMQEQFYGWV